MWPNQQRKHQGFLTGDTGKVTPLPGLLPWLEALCSEDLATSCRLLQQLVQPNPPPDMALMLSPVTEKVSNRPTAVLKWES